MNRWVEDRAALGSDDHVVCRVVATLAAVFVWFLILAGVAVLIGVNR